MELHNNFQIIQTGFFSIKGLARISLLRSNEITEFKRVPKDRTNYYNHRDFPDTKGLKVLESTSAKHQKPAER
jgi:hypothetical protein